MPDKKAMEARIKLLFPSGLQVLSSPQSILRSFPEEVVVSLAASVLLAIGQDPGERDGDLTNYVRAFIGGDRLLVRRLSDWISGGRPEEGPKESTPTEPTPTVPLEVQFAEFRTEVIKSLLELEMSMMSLTELVRGQDQIPEVSEARSHEDP